MIKAVVEFHVKETDIDLFIKASLRNAEASMKEPGIKGFDVLQSQDDPAQFLFVETYLSPEDQLRHRETTHYSLWKNEIESMLARARTNVKYNVLEE